MIDVDQLNLVLLDLIKQGKESLIHRGVSVVEDMTLEEIIQKIKEIPIYDFNKSGIQMESSIQKTEHNYIHEIINCPTSPSFNITFKKII